MLFAFKIISIPPFVSWKKQDFKIDKNKDKKANDKMYIIKF